MNKLLIKLAKQHKSFETNFQYIFEGDLILLSGVNGAGKTQIIDIINGQEGKNQGNEIQSKISLDEIVVHKKDIEYRSFKDNISIPEITQSTSQTFLKSSTQCWSFYQNHNLDPNINRVLPGEDSAQYSDSCIKAKNILLKSVSETEFNQKNISEIKFKKILQEKNFIWKKNDTFNNAIGEIFFNHAIKVQQGRSEIGKTGGDPFDETILGTAPWKELNDLFSELKLDYRFKDNYEISCAEINEQPKLFPQKNDGTLDESNPRQLRDLSDGEKAIISLCFASLSGTTSKEKKILLFDEIDAVLNPSLIEKFFIVIKKYFIDKGIMVVMATHSPATISLAPECTKYYEVFKKGESTSRILEVDRDDYSELQKVNKKFYDKIDNQEERIKELETIIKSDEDILIITEGKTDWKYMLKALEYFQNKQEKEFEEIKEGYFYKFGCQEDVDNNICGTNIVNELCDSKLKNYLTGLQNSRIIDSSQISKKRIGIFDSDTNIKVINEKSLGILSFKIEPNNISTEFLFSDDEIKTKIAEKRLYIGEEFDNRTTRHKSDNLNLGKNTQNKAGKRVIIDTDVYNQSDENVALPKEKFAKAVYNDDVKISIDSWENFKHIFEKIEEFLK